jgi:hypothetical protein
MISLWPRPEKESRQVDQRLFREAMGRPTVSRELFLPLDRAWWDGGRFTLGKWRLRAPRPSLRGVRLQEPRPANQGPPPERDTQADLLALLGSVAELRRVPELSGLVLSDETLVGSQRGTVPGKRILFGLSCPPGGRFDDEPKAAGECHRVLSRALKKAGFAVEQSGQAFNPSSGFDGLRNWAATVRLKRQGRRNSWVILALLVLLCVALPFLPIPGTGALPSVGSLSAAGGAPAPVSKLPTGAPPAGSDPFAGISSLPSGKELEQLQKLLPGATAANGEKGGLESLERGSQSGLTLMQVGTVLYFISGAWLIWAAEAGILSVIGLLIIPAYPLVLARNNWSKTWIPVLLHVASMVMIIAGIYYIFAPYLRLLSAAGV